MRMDGSLCLQRANPAPYRLSACDVGELFRELWRRRCCDDAQLPLRVCCIPQPLGSRMLTSFILLLILIPFLWHCTRLHIEIKWIFVCVLMKVFNKLKNQGNIWAVRPGKDLLVISHLLTKMLLSFLAAFWRMAQIRGRHQSEDEIHCQVLRNLRKENANNHHPKKLNKAVLCWLVVACIDLPLLPLLLCLSRHLAILK